MKLKAGTQYIISTSGRETSIRRYERLLQDILDLNIAYLPISPIDNAEKLEALDFVNAIRGLGAIGGAISKDMKGTIVPLLDELEPLAEQVQSVNTVIRRGKRLIGYNTDAHGFREAIVNGIEGIEIRRAVVYGYGGVFQVVYQVLSDLGIAVQVTGRRSDVALEVSKKHGLTPYDGQPCDLFVNASPVTDKPLDQAVGFLEAIQGARLVFDHEMPGQYLTDYCQEHGVKHIAGTSMYYPQMYRQWALFLDGIVAKDEIPELIKRASSS